MANFELACAKYGVRLFVLPPPLQNSMGALKDQKYAFRQIRHCVCSGKRLEVSEKELEKFGMGLEQYSSSLHSGLSDAQTV